MSAHVAVLFANDAFYLAFATRDLAAMDALWARRAPVSCIHPGWNLLAGRDEVMRSWQAILGSPNSPKIKCRNPEARLNGTTAYVVCYEEVAQGFLVATNIFVREDDAWKVVHHQAGATSPPIFQEEPDASERVQ